MNEKQGSPESQISSEVLSQNGFLRSSIYLYEEFHHQAPIHFSNTTYSTTSGVKSYEVAGTPAIGMFLPLDKEAMFDNDAGRLSGIYDDTYLLTTFLEQGRGGFTNTAEKRDNGQLDFPHEGGIQKLNGTDKYVPHSYMLATKNKAEGDQQLRFGIHFPWDVRDRVICENFFTDYFLENMRQLNYKMVELGSVPFGGYSYVEYNFGSYLAIQRKQEQMGGKITLRVILKDWGSTMSQLNGTYMRNVAHSLETLMPFDEMELSIMDDKLLVGSSGPLRWAGQSPTNITTFAVDEHGTVLSILSNQVEPFSYWREKLVSFCITGDTVVFDAESIHLLQYQLLKFPKLKRLSLPMDGHGFLNFSGPSQAMRKLKFLEHLILEVKNAVPQNHAMASLLTKYSRPFLREAVTLVEKSLIEKDQQGHKRLCPVFHRLQIRLSHDHRSDFSNGGMWDISRDGDLLGRFVRSPFPSGYKIGEVRGLVVSSLTAAEYGFSRKGGLTQIYLTTQMAFELAQLVAKSTGTANVGGGQISLASYFGVIEVADFQSPWAPTVEKQVQPQSTKGIQQVRFLMRNLPPKLRVLGMHRTAYGGIIATNSKTEETWTRDPSQKKGYSWDPAKSIVLGFARVPTLMVFMLTWRQYQQNMGLPQSHVLFQSPFWAEKEKQDGSKVKYSFAQTSMCVIWHALAPMIMCRQFGEKLGKDSRDDLVKRGVPEEHIQNLEKAKGIEPQLYCHLLAYQLKERSGLRNAFGSSVLLWFIRNKYVVSGCGEVVKRPGELFGKSRMKRTRL